MRTRCRLARRRRTRPSTVEPVRVTTGPSGCWRGDWGTPVRHDRSQMGVLLGWLDRVQRRSRAAGFVIAVIYKIVDDQGTYLAAMITYYAFVSTFPLLLLLTTILAVVLVG